jgi:acetolactate synthase-1/2/3 large subunit
MNSQELETAMRLNIPVVVLILNDNGFGFIKWKQRNAGFPDFGLSYENPDFVKYAESYGAVGMRVNTGEDLTGLLRKAFTLKTVVLIECPIDYSHNFETFSKELGNLSREC